jgi:membrane protein DedA with SNARE-associated domain
MRILKIIALVICGVFTMGCGVCTISFMAVGQSDYFSYQMWFLIGVLPTILFGAICWWLIRSLRKPKP